MQKKEEEICPICHGGDNDEDGCLGKCSFGCKCVYSIHLSCLRSCAAEKHTCPMCRYAYKGIPWIILMCMVATRLLDKCTTNRFIWTLIIMCVFISIISEIVIRGSPIECETGSVVSYWCTIHSVTSVVTLNRLFFSRVMLSVMEILLCLLLIFMKYVNRRVIRTPFMEPPWRPIQKNKIQ